MPRDEHRPIVKTADEARAGVTGQGVPYVLGFSTAGAIALFVTVFLSDFV
jgi:hypothetical protein